MKNLKRFGIIAFVAMILLTLPGCNLGCPNSGCSATMNADGSFNVDHCSQSSCAVASWVSGGTQGSVPSCDC